MEPGGKMFKFSVFCLEFTAVNYLILTYLETCTIRSDLKFSDMFSFKMNRRLPLGSKAPTAPEWGSEKTLGMGLSVFGESSTRDSATSFVKYMVTQYASWMPYFP